jgi:Flp pilus assembly protein TadD
MADKSEPKAAEVVRLCLVTGRVLDKHNDVAGAITQYERVLKYDPNNYQAVRRLAVLYDRSRPPDFSKAEAFYQRLAKHSPRDADLFNDWGYSYYLREQKTEAEKCLRQALQMDPNHKRAHSNLGLVLGQQKRYQEAFEAFRAAGVSEAEAHSNLAFVYLSQGKREDACRECRIAQRLSPSCKPAQDMLAKLDSAADEAPRALASRTERPRPRRPDREAVRQSLPAEFRREPSASAPVATNDAEPGTRSSAGGEAPAPVYTSPNGTKWMPVPQGMKWHTSVKNDPTPPARDDGNGQPGTATFEDP